MTSPATSQVIEAGEKLARTFAQSVSSPAVSSPGTAAESPSIGGAHNYLGSPGTDPSRTADSTDRGVSIRLPDGSIVTAPNAEAAGAVRSALTQQGVPYSWGGTTPGSGLDCSGLTQWAYAQQGVEIPRLAQDQDIGSAVTAGEVMPGDLAVWDGHVAMVIGNGQLVEAGDPVQVGPIRTTNSGMGFKGFFRPTE